MRLSLRGLVYGAGVRWCLLVLCSAYAVFFASPVGAHDLEIDRLSLWPAVSEGTLRGQLLFDPELTRRLTDPTGPQAEAAVLRFVREQLKIEVDGAALAFDCDVRELWVPAGATPGDSVMIDARLPKRARELRVFVPAAMKELLVVVAPRDSGAGSKQHIVAGGHWAGPYPLSLVGGSALADGELSYGASAPSTSGAPAPLTSVTPPTAKPERPQAAPLRWLLLGFHHILPAGVDHMLFVVGLVLGARRRFRPTLLLLTAFTAAHTATLALAASGVLVLPATLVEPLIALSIVWVGLENLFRQEQPLRPLVVLGFGLLHGSGFAGALATTGITQGALLWPLLLFNVGVELGQLAVVALLLALLYPVRDPAKLERYAVRPLSIGIAALGLFWAIERAFQ